MFFFFLFAANAEKESLNSTTRLHEAPRAAKKSRSWKTGREKSESKMQSAVFE